MLGINALLHWPIYRLPTAASTGGNPISLSTFPFSRGGDPDPTTRPSSVGEPNIQPTTNRPSNRPPDEPTTGVRSRRRWFSSVSRLLAGNPRIRPTFLSRYNYIAMHREGWRALCRTRSCLPRVSPSCSNLVRANINLTNFLFNLIFNLYCIFN